jgi:hypothetical protein
MQNVTARKECGTPFLNILDFRFAILDWQAEIDKRHCSKPALEEKTCKMIGSQVTLVCRRFWILIEFESEGGENATERSNI